MTKTYNNIQDVNTTNLYKMLSLKQFQDDESQKMIKDETELSIESHSLYCSHQTLSIVDIGFRTYSPYMIKMADSLSPADRFEVKKE